MMMHIIAVRMIIVFMIYAIRLLNPLGGWPVKPPAHLEGVAAGGEG